MHLIRLSSLDYVIVCGISQNFSRVNGNSSSKTLATYNIELGMSCKQIADSSNATQVSI